MARSGRLAVLVSLLLPSGLLAQSPERFALRGVVLGGESGDPLPYALVVLEPDRKRFADAQGGFVFFNLPAGTYRLRARQVGYRPYDSTITVAASTAPLRITLPRITVQLASIIIAARGRCRTPAPPNPETQAELAAVLDQLRANAQRHSLLLDAYPFRYKVERTLIDFYRSLPESSIVDTLVLPSTGRWRYAPGTVVADDPNRPGGRLVHIPILADLADSVFQATHCFRYAGIETAEGESLIRVDYQVAESVRTPDVNGTVYLDPATYMVRHTMFTVTRIEQAAHGATSFSASATFRELLPNLIIVDLVESRTELQASHSPRAPAGRSERQRLLLVDFERGVPGSP